MSNSAIESVATPTWTRIAPLAQLCRFVAPLRNRPDSEHELTINRLALSGIVFSYLVIASMFGSTSAVEMLRTDGILFLLYYIISIGFFLHILYQPNVSVVRRVLGILIDLGMFSYGMHIGGEATAPFFPIYLWVIFGNGFRFGIPYLVAAAATGLVGFGLVAIATEFWQQHQSLAIGLLASLVFLPVYVSSLIRKLSAAKQQAEDASKSKSLFLASVSHELRTPLNAIIGLSDLLMDTRLDPEQQDMTHTIGRSGRVLLSHINTILDFSRIEAGQTPTNNVEFDLHAAVAEVRKMLTSQASLKNVRLALHITPRTPRFVRADLRHLNEILVNLLGNAVKFTDKGFVVIGVDAVTRSENKARLRFEVTDTGIGIAPKAQARIFESFVQADETILDRFGGTGLGLALVKQIVELHGGEIGVVSAPGAGSTFWCEIEFQIPAASAAPAARYDGAVVLLSDDSTVRERLAAAGADVKTADSLAAARDATAQLIEAGKRPVVIVDERLVDSDLDEAARTLIGPRPSMEPSLILLSKEPLEGMLTTPTRSQFVTALTCLFDEEALNAALRIASSRDAVDRQPDAGTLGKGGRKLKVLVAEDNRTNQKVISKILERAGHQVKIAENGEAALDALSSQSFDIVLMDVNMPVMNGIDTTKFYRFASLGQPRIPIVALTADATPEMDVRCREAGMDICVTKPIEPARLLELIEAMVPRSDADGAAPALVMPTSDLTDISAHHQFQGLAPTAVNIRVLDDLKTLGGADFAGELVAQFFNDSGDVLHDLAAAVAEGDVQQFRERAHALRSAAANVGAQGVYEMCLSWREIGSRELAAQGEAYMERLRAELERVRTLLDGYLAGHESAPFLAPAEEEPRENAETGTAH